MVWERVSSSSQIPIYHSPIWVLLSFECNRYEEADAIQPYPPIYLPNQPGINIFFNLISWFIPKNENITIKFQNSYAEAVTVKPEKPMRSHEAET